MTNRGARDLFSYCKVIVIILIIGFAVIRIATFGKFVFLVRLNLVKKSNNKFADFSLRFYSILHAWKREGFFPSLNSFFMHLHASSFMFQKGDCIP